jgi:apolipoprotein N-acyltransferase
MGPAHRSSLSRDQASVRSRFAFVPPCPLVRQRNRDKSKGRGNFSVFFFFTAGVRFAEREWLGLGMGGVMDAKLAMLVVLFGSIIGLSCLTAENLARLKRWRKAAP